MVARCNSSGIFAKKSRIEWHLPKLIVIRYVLGTIWTPPENLTMIKENSKGAQEIFCTNLSLSLKKRVREFPVVLYCVGCRWENFMYSNWNCINPFLYFLDSLVAMLKKCSVTWWFELGLPNRIVCKFCHFTHCVNYFMLLNFSMLWCSSLQNCSNNQVVVRIDWRR